MSGDASVATEPRPSAGFEWSLGIVACAILFGPLFVVSAYIARPDHLSIDAAAETVGIGVILRAMLRRLFRSGARSVMQTTVGTVARASSRTMTRRVVRVGVKSLTTLFRRSSSWNDSSSDEADATINSQPSQSSVLAVVTGFFALGLSLAGVFLVVDLEQSSSSLAPGVDVVLGGMPLVVAVPLGAIPLLVYAVILLTAAPACGARVRFRTGWEALLLQAYFTGSGSYLPLSTDSEIEGPQPARVRLALVALGGLLTLHWVFAAAGALSGSYPLEYMGGMFLLYCFVFSFPIAPLDGYHLWRSSPWLWVAAWIPILTSFTLIMPEPLHVVL